MNRRQVLKLGAVMGGAVALGGVWRMGGRAALAQSSAVPTVDRLVMTTVVDNFYDAFARSGKLDTITVQRTVLPSGRPLIAEHGLAYHFESVRGQERREILLDFGYRTPTLVNNYAALKAEPLNADALIISHGHVDHFGGLPDFALVAQGRWKPSLTLYVGGEDTFCHPMVVNPPGGAQDYGQLNRAGLEGSGLKVVLAR